MNSAEIFLLSIALGMDCFAVSIACGIALVKPHRPTILRTAFLFGLFQALMPLLSWRAAISLADLIRDYDHWIAFGLLVFLGGRMIIGALRKKDEVSRHLTPTQLNTQLTLAVATSIDALAVGITLAAMNYDSLSDLFFPLAVIGIGAALLSVLGFALGLRFGNIVRQRIKPEILGGIILLAIGTKVLISHLLENY